MSFVSPFRERRYKDTKKISKKQMKWEEMCEKVTNLMGKQGEGI